MLILHTAFEQDALYLWGESSFERPRSKEKDGLKVLPWGASAMKLRAALRLCGIRRGRKAPTENGVCVCLLLPTRGKFPLPSSPMLGEPHSSGEEELVLEPFCTEALEITSAELTKIRSMICEGGERLAYPGLLFADDAKFMCHALEYAATLIQRGCYIPDMEPREGGFVSQWRPIILAKYQEEFSAFAEALPLVLCAFSSGTTIDKPKTKRDTASALLACLTDMIIRSSQQGTDDHGRRIRSDNPHEIWLRSLIWQKAPLEKWNTEMTALYPQIRAWADSLISVTAQPWRLFIRLGEPIDGEPIDGLQRFRLSWNLQSAQDPSLIIPAEHVWAPTAAERSWFEHTQTNPRRYMLQILGHLASRIPYIEKSLETSRPCECILSLEELFDFLENHLTSIIDQGIQVQLPSAWGQFSDRPHLSVRAEVRDPAAFTPGAAVSLTDVLDVDWSVALGNDVLTQNELKMLTEMKTPLVNLRGRWVLVCRNEVEKITDALKKLPQKIERREALLSSLRREHMGTPISEVGGSPWLTGVRALLLGTEPLNEATEPEGFTGTLRPYQGKGLAWLQRLVHLGLGACLADDMGLGKTVQTLALIESLRVCGEDRPVLLVCPTSVMENWRRESERFVPGMKTIIHHGIKRSKKKAFAPEELSDAMVVTSYSLLHRDSAIFSGTDWAGVILDEAQNIKNPDTCQSRAARALHSDWRIALTGTPVENHVGDMWSIMEFLVPGLMPNRARFSREILRPVQAGEKKAMERVRRMTAPFILRRLKTDKEIISDLPEKIESREFCPLSREQASLYSAVTTSLEHELDGSLGGIKRKGVVLAAITALKQICDHPLLYLKDRSEIGSRSGKLARMAELAEEMLSAGDRALIFTQYAEMGSVLKKFLQETFGRETLFLHGGVPREKRNEMVRRFQEEESGPPFFVLSLKAGGTGLNLTRANHVVMFDRWWNPAVEQQAVDRAYRIGQKKNVNVRYFCCRGTLEEKIESLINAKRELAEMLVSTGENWITELSDSDLHELFALEKEAVDTL